MKLIERMEAEVAEQVDAIMAEAKKKAVAVVSESKGVISRLEEEARRTSDKRLVLEKAKRAARITQDYKRKEAELKQKLVDKVFDAARTELDRFVDTAGYDEAFPRIAEQAFLDFEGKAMISVREGDRDRATKAAKAAGLDVEVTEDLRGLGGGLVVRSPDGKTFIDGSLHTRLVRARIEGVQASGRILFWGGSEAGFEETSEEVETEESAKKDQSKKRKPRKKKS